MRETRFALAATLIVFVTACGGHNPTAPGDAVPGATGLAIAGADAILSGVPTSYTASATFSDRTTRAVAPGWTSSNPAVATVDANGRVEGRSHGSFVLTASYAGHDVSKTVQVINNYGGRWGGQQRVTSCEETGDYHGCRWVSTPGIYLLSIDIAQDTSNPREVVIKALNLRGTVTDDGRLSLSGVTRLVGDDEVTEVGILERQWDVSLSAADAVAGHVDEDYRWTVPLGTDRVGYELTMTRTPASMMVTQ
jgi:Bacterial Ig-like domain (group 2)